jgi:hypothetical protein
VPQFRRRSKTSAANCARLCSVLRMKDKSAVGARVAACIIADENARKKCRPHKNDAITSNTSDVRRCNFRCTHRTQGDRTIRCCRGMIRIALCDSRRRLSVDQLVTRRCEAIPRRSFQLARAQVVTGRGLGLSKSRQSRRATRRDSINPNKGCPRATIVAWPQQ